MWSHILAQIVILFAVIDPIGSIPVYLEATKQLNGQHTRKVAIIGPLVAFGIFLLRPPASVCIPRHT